MRFTHTFLASPLRLLLLALALAGSAAAIATAATGASAASGGIGTGGGAGATAVAPSDVDLSSAKYAQLWERVTPANKRWARSTSDCESGHDPDAIGGNGVYRGAFQFTKQTWSTSPKTPGGDPIDYDYKTQAVVAVNLKLRVGTGPWPVCG
ncbi:MAG: transglycosylase family protein [Solirubrobacterales bacterium]|nr:transglycosylase family protein [Solirubrobacterales bacterium]